MKNLTKLTNLFLMFAILLTPIQVFAEDTNLNSFSDVLTSNCFTNDAVEGTMFWVDPFSGERIKSNTNTSISFNNDSVDGTMFWVDPFSGERTEKSLYDSENYSSSISPSLRVDTTWRTYLEGAMPLLALNTSVYTGVYSSTNGAVQMRVVRNPWASPLEFHATARSVNVGTGFNFNVPRGDLFYVQARMTEGESTVRFESR